jgi:hypothetical protein
MPLLDILTALIHFILFTAFSCDIICYSCCYSVYDLVYDSHGSHTRKKKSYLVPHFDFFPVCQDSFSQTLIVFFS